MTDYVVIVEFRLKPNKRTLFRRLVDANAIASVRSEPGCRRFDVLEPRPEGDRIVLYEVYRDRDAFEEHLGTPHFAAFNAAVADLVAGKTVSDYELVCTGTGLQAGRCEDEGAVAAIAE